MSEPPLFLEAGASGFVQAALMGQEPFVPAGQEHGVKFQPLGGVQRHQVDAVRPFLGGGVHHQRYVLHKAGERVELLHEVDQFFQVFETPFGLLRPVRLPHAGITGLVQDQLRELRMPHRVDQGAPAVERREQGGERAARFWLQVLGLDNQPCRLRQRNLARSCQLMQRFESRITEAPPGNVDDAFEFEIVGGVQRYIEIGDCVANLLPLVKAWTADHAVIQAERDEPVLEGAHLKRRADEDRDFVQRVPLALKLLDILADDTRFFLVVPAALNHDLLAVVAVGMQGLAEAPLVVSDQA